jgi:hypothetical protein
MGPVGDQFDENGTARLGQGIDQRREGDRIGIISVESVADAKPYIEIREQVFGSN